MREREERERRDRKRMIERVHGHKPFLPHEKHHQKQLPFFTPYRHKGCNRANIHSLIADRSRPSLARNTSYLGHTGWKQTMG
jgi:hypothetical protein